MEDDRGVPYPARLDQRLRLGGGIDVDRSGTGGWSIATNEIAAYAPDSDTWRILPTVDLAGDAGVLRWTGADLYAFADRAYSQPVPGAPLEAARLNQEGGWEAISPVEFSTDDLIIGASSRIDSMGRGPFPRLD